MIKPSQIAGKFTAPKTEKIQPDFLSVFRPEQANNIQEYLSNPTFDNWDKIIGYGIPNPDRFRTIWQAVIDIDSSFPRNGRSEDEKGRTTKEWTAKPSPATVIAAIEKVLGKEETTVLPTNTRQSSNSSPGVSIELNSTDLTKMVSDNEKHIKYVPVSNACGYDLGTVVPKGMAQEMYNALHEVKKQLELKFGLDLDGFVQDRLQFTPEELGIDRALYDSKTKEEQIQLINNNLCNVFAPEQIDAIALAIYNIEIRKVGMIEGDMTGIGKGRVAAAIVRYTIKHMKRVPIFLTEKTYLFSDLFRDFIDIASDPNIPQQIKTGEQRKEIKMTKAQMASRIKEFMENGDTKEEAVEKVEEMADLGFEMVPIYETNKNYDEQVRRAKKTRLQVNPFIINNSDSLNRVKNLNGDILYYAQRNSEESFKSAIAKKKLPKEYNLILTTYSQLRGQAMSSKMEWFKSMCQGTVVICDESHNASGDSNTGRFLLESLQLSQSAIFLSATYAKRADNMVIYGAKTSMKETGLPKADMILAIESGGVPLQEIISSQLVAEGQMIRRERTYAGVDVFYNILDASMAATGHPEYDMADKHKAIADVFTNILRQIIELQSVDVSKWASKADVAKKYIGEAYGEVEVSKGFNVEKALTSSPMFSRVFNLINQLLFSIKAEAIADRAISYLKQGKKPVISFANTMESFMDGLTNDEGNPLNDGDLISSDFKRVLEKLLDNIFFVTIKSPTGEKTKIRLDIREFPIEIQQKYKKIKQDIKQISIGISISPIDVLLKKIREAGFSVEEITGRSGKLNYTDDTFMYATYERRLKASATDIFRGFNQNKIDCVLVNQSGATGGSIHATPNYLVNKVRVKDKDGNTSTVVYDKNMIQEIVVPDSLEPRDEVKQRVMIILQPELNINTEVQKRGRIFRSGQVLPPMYEYMSTAIPAEKRLQMMLQRKLQSLDSNTSANQKQSDNLINIVDFLNKYGDTLVIKYLKENQPLIFKLGDPLKMWDESKKEIKETPGAPENAAYKVSGRVAILSVSEQEKFYSEISERYIDYVRMLESMNEYDLEVKYLDLQATSLEREVFIVGTGGTSLFGRNSIMERCEVNNLRKPYNKAELELMLQDELQQWSGYNDPGKQQQRSLLDEHAAFHKQRQEGLLSYYKEEEEASIAKLERDEKYLRQKEKFPEESAKWLETMITSVRAKNAEDYQYDKDKQGATFEYIKNYLRKIHTGMVTNYVKGEIKVRAIVIGIEIDRRKFNPWTPGNIKIRLAIANGVRMVIIPLTNDVLINSLIAETELSYTDTILSQWNKITKEAASDRKPAYIITGNILQAMANENVIQYGRLIKYTTDKKKIRNGILMMDEFNPSTGEGRGAVVKIPIRFCQPILDNMDAAKGTRYVTTDGIEITKEKNNLDFIIKVRKNKESNPIILNETILGMMNVTKGFTDWGTIAMWDPKEGVDVNYPAMGNTIDRDNIQPFLDYLSKEYNSCLKVARAIFEKEKELLGIDFSTSYDDGKEINESESGLAQVKVDLDDPLFQQIVEAQQDPVSEAGQQIIVVPETETVIDAPAVQIAAEVTELEIEKQNFAFEKKLLKFYKMILPLVPHEVEAPANSKIKVFIADTPWWLRKIDHTHLALSNEEERSGTPMHIGQLYSRTPFATNEFYKDVEKWLAGSLDINGKSYQSFEQGGALSTEKYDDQVLLGFANYVSGIWNGDIQSFHMNESARIKELSEDRKMLAGLMAGQVTPSKVVGTGYKNPRKIAKEYLEGEIQRIEGIISTKGQLDTTTQSNFLYHVFGLYNHGKISTQEVIRLMEEMPENLPGRYKERLEGLKASTKASGGSMDEENPICVTLHYGLNVGGGNYYIVCETESVAKAIYKSLSDYAAGKITREELESDLHEEHVMTNARPMFSIQKRPNKTFKIWDSGYINALPVFNIEPVMLNERIESLHQHFADGGNFASGGVMGVGRTNYSVKTPFFTSPESIIKSLTGNIGGNQGDLLDNTIKFVGYEDLEPGDAHYMVFEGNGKLSTGITSRPSPQQKVEILHDIIGQVLMNNHGVRSLEVAYITSGNKRWYAQDFYASGGAVGRYTDTKEPFYGDGTDVWVMLNGSPVKAKVVEHIASSTNKPNEYRHDYFLTSSGFIEPVLRFGQNAMASTKEELLAQWNTPAFAAGGTIPAKYDKYVWHIGFNSLEDKNAAIKAMLSTFDNALDYISESNHLANEFLTSVIYTTSADLPKGYKERFKAELEKIPGVNKVVVEFKPADKLKMGRLGEWLASGGRVKDLDIVVGAKFKLINEEVIEIKRLFTENIDEDWVEYTRDGKTNENSVKALRIFLNNWQAAQIGHMANGGSISYGDFGKDHLAWAIANLVYDYHYSGLTVGEILGILSNERPNLTEAEISKKIKDVLIPEHGYVWNGEPDTKVYFKAFVRENTFNKIREKYYEQYHQEQGFDLREENGKAVVYFYGPNEWAKKLAEKIKSEFPDVRLVDTDRIKKAFGGNLRRKVKREPEIIYDRVWELTIKMPHAVKAIKKEILMGPKSTEFDLQNQISRMRLGGSKELNEGAIMAVNDRGLRERKRFEMGGSAGGETKPSKTFRVFNYTDNLYASPETFTSKKAGRDFIKGFRAQFAGQGYYRDNQMNKISPEHIDLEIIPDNWNPISGKFEEHAVFEGMAKGGKLDKSYLDFAKTTGRVKFIQMSPWQIVPENGKFSMSDDNYQLTTIVRNYGHDKWQKMTPEERNAFLIKYDKSYLPGGKNASGEVWYSEVPKMPWSKLSNVDNYQYAAYLHNALLDTVGIVEPSPPAVFPAENPNADKIGLDLHWIERKRLMLKYLKSEYPEYTDAKMANDPTYDDSEQGDNNYNDAFLEMVDDLRDQYLTDEEQDSANAIVEDYMSSTDKKELGGDLSKGEIPASYYHWGEFQNEENLGIADFSEMRQLSPDEILGFSIRPEDEDRLFFANENYIDSDDEGTAVKHAYAVEKKFATDRFSKGGSAKKKHRGKANGVDLSSATHDAHLRKEGNEYILDVFDSSVEDNDVAHVESKPFISDAAAKEYFSENYGAIQDSNHKPAISWIASQEAINLKKVYGRDAVSEMFANGESDKWDNLPPKEIYDSSTWQGIAYKNGYNEGLTPSAELISIYKEINKLQEEYGALMALPQNKKKRRQDVDRVKWHKIGELYKQAEELTEGLKK